MSALSLGNLRRSMVTTVLACVLLSGTTAAATLAIVNQDAVKAHAGHHVKLSGSKTDDGIKVEKVEMVAKGGQ